MSALPIKILLIEDDEDDYVITRSLFSELETVRFDLEWVKTYDSALVRMIQNQHDVYLVDYRLGEKSGLDLLRVSVIQGCQAPIILLTGQGDQDVDIAAMMAGAADYLVKGALNAQTLERSIRYALERKRTLRELQRILQEKSLLASAIANLNTGVIITDPNLPDNPIIFANPGFSLVTGYSVEEVMGKNCRFLQSPETDPEVLQHLREAIAAQESFTCTLLNRRKDGTSFWNELMISPIFNHEGKLTNFIGLLTDVSAREHSRQDLEQLRRQHELILNSAGEGIYGLDLRGKATFINPAAARMVGWEIEELLGQPIDTILRYANAEQRAQASPIHVLQPALNDGAVHRVDDIIFWRKDGSCFPVESISTPIRENGQMVGVVVTFQDITERKRHEEALCESEERYALAVKGANDGIWDWNLRTDEVYYSPRWKSMLGYTDTEIGTGLDEWFGRVHPDDLAWVRLKINAHLEGLTPYLESEHRMRHQDGSYRWMLVRGFAVKDSQGEPTRIAGSQTDITSRKQAEEQLLHNAFYDALTGLPNRALLLDHLRHAIKLADRNSDFVFSVLFIDLDRFKVINDSLGHVQGDQLLVAIAQRLSGCLRPGDTIARLGGDEFVILLEDIKDVSSVTLIADRIQHELTQPFNLDGHEVFTTASIGIALSGSGNMQPEDLVRDADTAMYRAKAQGRARYEIFNTNMHTRAVALLQIETDLRRSVSALGVNFSKAIAPFCQFDSSNPESREFILHYQPIVSLRTRQIKGFEALVRWRHPQRGIVSPADFIPIAEETGLIIPLGHWVLREACYQMKAWHSRYAFTPPLLINVNLSGKQFTPQLIEQVSQILQETQLNPRCLKLEITESILMENAESAIGILSELQSLGIQLSIDDFGTGYSSLSYLHRFPIDTLKIDRSFINKLDVDAEQLAIVRTIMTLAWNLGMDVVAEGVETAKQLAQLRALQCEHGQGYLFAKPLDSHAAEDLLTQELNSLTSHSL